MRGCGVMTCAGAFLRLLAFVITLISFRMSTCRTQIILAQSRFRGLLRHDGLQIPDQRFLCRDVDALASPAPIFSVPRVPRPFVGIFHPLPYWDQPVLLRVL